MDEIFESPSFHNNCCMFRNRKRFLRKNQRSVATQCPACDRPGLSTAEDRFENRNIETAKKALKIHHLRRAHVPVRRTPSDLILSSTSSESNEEDPRKRKVPPVAYPSYIKRRPPCE
ncbi:uncharacterized protein LOC115771339 [Drosophila novamexicana]|uniref:uncharacterized protein LOC115771339 n=1 Tax=Drosophila novamexicana TaxID=47314 RepID=UPI0011E59C59|nr:uncharacterized protein LOC115771339 [Drosophila novamexicana]